MVNTSPVTVVGESSPLPCPGTLDGGNGGSLGFDSDLDCGVETAGFWLLPSYDIFDVTIFCMIPAKACKSSQVILRIPQHTGNAISK